jgi:hypothetical protein
MVTIEYLAGCARPPARFITSVHRERQGAACSRFKFSVLRSGGLRGRARDSMSARTQFRKGVPFKNKPGFHQQFDLIREKYLYNGRRVGEYPS